MRRGTKLLSGALIVGLLTGGSVLASELPTAAHTGDLKVTATCINETGEYELLSKLTLTQTNLAGSSKWRVGSASFEGTPSSDAGMDRGPLASSGATTLTLGTFRLPGTTTGLGPWVYAHTTWSDGFKKGSDGQLTTALKGDCKRDKPTEPPVKEVPGSETLPPNCESKLVVTKHWLDKTTYTFDSVKWEYVGTTVRINLPDTSVSITDEQAAVCAGDKPDILVVESELIKGEVKCGETTRTDTGTRTETDWVREAGSTVWVEGTPVITPITKVVDVKPTPCPVTKHEDKLATTGVDMTPVWVALLALVSGLVLFFTRKKGAHRA